MKRFFSIMTVVLLALPTIVKAQSEFSVVDVQKNETLVSDIPSASKGKFQFGASVRWGFNFIFSMEEAVVINGGYRFNRRNYLGLNVGVAKIEEILRLKDSDDGLKSAKYIGCPISLDYIHYFPVGKSKKHSVLLGAEAGWVVPFGKSYIGEYAEGETDEALEGTPIASIKVGMDHPIYKRMHLDWSIRLGVLAGGIALGVSF